MNFKTNEYLKKIDENILTLESDTSISKGYLKDISSNITSVKLDIDNVNDNLVDIGITLGKDKNFFCSKLTYNGNEYLSQSDYSSNNIVGGYYNNTNKPIYINNFRFIYASTGTPTIAGMYHSSNFTTKIGEYNTDFTDQSRTISSNTEQAKESVRRTYFDTTVWDWTYSLTNHPIEIPVGVTFGHSISGDFSSGYSTSPIGYLEGYTLQ